MSYDPQNIFARIIRGEIPCEKVYEDEFTLAFNDVSPRAPVHVLVIPKGPYTSLSDFSTQATAEEITAFYLAVDKVAKLSGLDADGYRAITNVGANANQEVLHYHLHLLGGCKLGSMVKKGLVD